MEQPAELIIENGRGITNYWRDLWRYRELFYFLAWRDILVRYKQTAIGIAWSVLRPLFTMAVFCIVFGRIAKLPSDGAPYPVMVFAAMLPWQFFAAALAETSNSLVGNSGMISKIYFPRLILPVSAVAVCLVDFFISFLILLGLMAWYHYPPTWHLIILPFFLLLSFLAALGVGLWMAVMNVKYRDFQHLVPFLLQAGLYLSPVGFSSSVVPDNWRLLYSLNPMVGVIDGFRWALLGKQLTIYWPGFWISVLLVLVIFFSAIRFFRAAERKFTDIL